MELDKIEFESVTIAEFWKMLAPDCPCLECEHLGENCEDRDCRDYEAWLDSLVGEEE